MTAEQHIKNAYSELLKAADVVKQEVGQLRSTLTDTKQLMGVQLVQLEEQIRLLQKQQRVPDNGSQQQSLQTQLGRLQRQMSDKKREMNDEIRRIEELIHQKERDSVTIQSQAQTVAS